MTNSFSTGSLDQYHSHTQPLGCLMHLDHGNQMLCQRVTECTGHRDVQPKFPSVARKPAWLGSVFGYFAVSALLSKRCENQYECIPSEAFLGLNRLDGVYWFPFQAVTHLLSKALAGAKSRRQFESLKRNYQIAAVGAKHRPTRIKLNQKGEVQC